VDEKRWKHKVQLLLRFVVQDGDTAATMDSSLREVADFFVWSMDLVGMDRAFMHDASRPWHSLTSALEELRKATAPLARPEVITVEHLEALVRVLTERMDLFVFILRQPKQVIESSPSHSITNPVHHSPKVS